MKNKRKENRFHRLTNLDDFSGNISWNFCQSARQIFMQQAVFGFFTCEHGLSLHITTVVQIWTYIWTVVQKDRSRSNYFQLAKIYFFLGVQMLSSIIPGFALRIINWLYRWDRYKNKIVPHNRPLFEKFSGLCTF